MRCANCGEYIPDVEDEGEEVMCENCKDEDYDDHTGDVGSF